MNRRDELTHKGIEHYLSKIDIDIPDDSRPKLLWGILLDNKDGMAIHCLVESSTVRAFTTLSRLLTYVAELKILEPASLDWLLTLAHTNHLCILHGDAYSLTVAIHCGTLFMKGNPAVGGPGLIVHDMTERPDVILSSISSILKVIAPRGLMIGEILSRTGEQEAIIIAEPKGITLETMVTTFPASVTGKTPFTPSKLLALLSSHPGKTKKGK